MSRYTVNGLPWSSGIGTSVTDCTTAREVMEKANLDFIVDKCELVAKMPFGFNRNNIINELDGDFAHDGHIFRTCPKAYCTYRADMSVPLGIVKDKYQVIQNREAFNFFDDAIGKDKAQWVYAGRFGYGHKIFITAKIPIETSVKGDKIDHYLVFSNSHDGSSSVNILFTPIRVLCTNMLNSALRSADSYIRFRHTQSASKKLVQGSEILNAAINHAKTATELYESLYYIKMSDDKVMEYLANLQLTDKEKELLLEYDPKNGYKKLILKDYLTLERTGISQRKANMISNMFNYYLDGIGQKPISGTAWGAYNAVTGFYSNVANLEGEKRVESLLYGGANSNMTKALVSATEIVHAA